MTKDQVPAPESDRIEGEGSYTATRRHRKSVEDFIDRGRVEPAAQSAQPQDAQEAAELRDAEREARSKARR
jgi:hypothetical protein